jgi:alpha-tubulin suppressor-like RCC1 family protein
MKTKWILAVIILAFGIALAFFACSSSSSSDDDSARDDDAADDDSTSLPVCKDLGGSSVYVKSVSPADGETRVLRMPVIVINFTDEIDSATFTADHVKLLQGSTSIPLVFPSPDGGTNNETTQPAQELAYVTKYTLDFDGLADNNGAAVPACQVSFTTKSKTAMIATGVGNSMSIDEDGTLWTWGDQLGSGVPPHTGTNDIPEKLDLGGNVVAIGPSANFGLAATEDGAVWGWGDNMFGELGQGNTDTITGEVQVQMTLPSGVTVKQLAVGDWHALALRSDHKVMAWGHNASGELGDGTTDDKSTPVEVANLTDVVAIAAGQGTSGEGSTDGGWSMALKSDGTVWGWGDNTSGETITADPMTPYLTTPTQVPVLPTITSIAVAGCVNAYAVDNNNSAWSWGTQYLGALGNGSCGLDTPEQPGQVSGAGGTGLLANVAMVAGGSSFGLAMLADGTVWGWGNDSSGALGDGTTGADADCGGGVDSPNTQTTPVQAQNITTAIAIAAASDQGLILLADGSVWAAGYNPNDKLGVGSDVPTLSGTDDVGIYAEVPGL